MNGEECARLVAIVRSLYPAQKFDDNPRTVVAAWGAVVADLPFDETHAAVTRIARRGDTWCSPGGVRGEVARARNVLTPDVDQLLTDIREVATRQGVGRRLLHPVARQVYDSIGGAESVKRLDARGLMSLRRTIETVADTHDHAVLADDLPAPQPPALPVAAKLEAIESVDERRRELSAPDPRPMPHDLRNQLDGFGQVDP